MKKIISAMKIIPAVKRLTVNGLNVRTRFIPVFFFLLTFIFMPGGNPCAFAEALIIGSTDGEAYTTATLNAALTGYDSLTKSGTGTSTVTLSSAFLNTASITVQSGVLAFTNSNPTNSTATDHVFSGTLHVNSGAELFLNAKDALGYTLQDSAARRITLEVAGTLRLRDGVNQTQRTVTLDLQGGTVTGGEYQYRSDVSELKATSGDSVIASKFTVRKDAVAPRFTVSQGASLTFTGLLAAESAQVEGVWQNVAVLTLDGAGKTVIRGAAENFRQIDVRNGTLEIASGSKVERKVPVYNVGAGGTLYLSALDVLGANGNAVTLNVAEGGTLKFLAGVNQTGRNMTLNLTGAALSDGNFLFMSADAYASALNILASGTTSVISTNILLRRQGDISDGTHVIRVEDGAAAADLSITGSIQGYNASTQNLTFSGAGTVQLAASASVTDIRTLTLDGVTLRLGKNNALNSDARLAMNLAKSTNGVSTLDLNGFSQRTASLTGESGKITNSAAGKAVLTVANGSEGTFKGSVAENIEVVKTGAGTWILAGTEHWNASVLTIQEGTVSVNTSYSAASAGRFLTGKITVQDGAVLRLAVSDALGGGAGGNASASGLTLDVLGTLSVTGNGNQTSRFMNYCLYGGTVNISSGGQILFMHSGTAPITTIHSFAQYSGTPVTETSKINGRLTVRDSGVRMTLDVEDGSAAADLWWTGTLKYGNNPVTGAGEIYKTGAGTLRLSNDAIYTAYDHTSGTTVAAGKLVLDAACVTGSDVTVNEGASFYGVNRSSVTKNLILNGNYELNLADLTLYADAPEQLHLTSMTFGENASASVNSDGVYSWESLNGLEILTFDSASARDAAFTSLAALLKANSETPEALRLSSHGTVGIALNINLSAVPEPSSWLLFLLGAAGMTGIGIRPGIRPGIRTEIRPGIRTEIRPGIRTEIRPGIRAGIRTGAAKNRFREE